jgi:hypothetical protein
MIDTDLPQRLARSWATYDEAMAEQGAADDPDGAYRARRAADLRAAAPLVDTHQRVLDAILNGAEAYDDLDEFIADVAHMGDAAAHSVLTRIAAALTERR